MDRGTNPDFRIKPLEKADPANRFHIDSAPYYRVDNLVSDAHPCSTTDTGRRDPFCRMFSNGEIKTITLPDGSQVTVNSGSILIYPEQLSGGERNVYLNGEAYFDVRSNPEKPFVVKANGMDVKVLGTRFDVMAYSDQSFVSAVLEEGSVEITVEEEQILLNPNEKLTYNRVSGEILHSKVESDYIAAWREGNLIFQQATLDEIIRTLEHRYNINVYLNSSA